MERAARLLAAMRGLAQGQSRAQRVLAVTLASAAGPECAGEPPSPAPAWLAPCCFRRLGCALPCRHALDRSALARSAARSSAGLFVKVPGLQSALAATLRELQEQLRRGPPRRPNPNGWALPAAILDRFQCDRSAPGQLCSLCQPAVVSSGRRGNAGEGGERQLGRQ